jgi:uncharacterized protein YyaL (SSP411 family)
MFNGTAVREARRDHQGLRRVSEDPEVHLLAAIAWLERAQDATPDDGVARAYSPAWNSYRRASGWQTSYPETTGYIIPTFFDAAAALERPDLRERATRMADWEIAVQIPDGSVMGGIIGEQAVPTPAVFNTGQVIFGWLRAHRETGSEAYLQAARRAGDFLLGCQDETGAFARGHSQFAKGSTTTYCSRVAWSLCQLGVAIEEERYVEAGRKNIEFCLTRQRPNGWFEDNCLTDATRPLLHTIAYAARGILEAGLLLGEERYVDAAHRVVEALRARQRGDGGLAGRFASDWSGAAEWSCVTGDAQTAIIAQRLESHLGDPKLREMADGLCTFVMGTQNLNSPDPGLAGGIKGSFPFDGDYGRYELLNWAAKFFVDATLNHLGKHPGR